MCNTERPELEDKMDVRWEKLHQNADLEKNATRETEMINVRTSSTHLLLCCKEYWSTEQFIPLITTCGILQKCT